MLQQDCSPVSIQSDIRVSFRRSLPAAAGLAGRVFAWPPCCCQGRSSFSVRSAGHVADLAICGKPLFAQRALSDASHRMPWLAKPIHRVSERRSSGSPGMLL
jgi:hypothetical protein